MLSGLGVSSAIATGTTVDGNYAIGVAVLGHTMSVLEDAIVVVVLGVVPLSLAEWSFSKQE